MCGKLFKLSCLLLGIAVFGPELSAQGPPRQNFVGPAAAAVDKVSLLPESVKTATSQNRTVYAIIIGAERDPNIGSGVGASAVGIQGLLNDTFPNQVQISTVGFFSADLASSGKGTYDVATVWQSIDELSSSVSADDIVFCYVMSHGAFDPSHTGPDYEYGHWFQTERLETLPRVNLMEKLLTLKARLTVLISDSCNVPVQGARVRPAPAIAAPSNFNNPALFSLLLENQGQVDINAASINQFAFYFPNSGGLFSDNFIALSKNDHRYTWDAFYGALRDQTQSDFRTRIGSYPNGNAPNGLQTSMTPMQMRSPTWVRSYRPTAAQAAAAAAAPAPAPAAPAEKK